VRVVTSVVSALVTVGSQLRRRVSDASRGFRTVVP
jgi:hypothetical protein